MKEELQSVQFLPQNQGKLKTSRVANQAALLAKDTSASPIWHKAAWGVHVHMKHIYLVDHGQATVICVLAAAHADAAQVGRC